jgi:AcrR family transcriptional regulator
MSTAGTRTRTRKPAAERSAEIVAAATALARDDGLSALTLRAVAERAGVAPALIAHYQPSMDDLVARVYTDLVAEEVRDVQTLLDAEPDPGRQVARLLSTLLDDVREDLTVVWVEGWALARRNEALAAAVRAQMAAWHAMVNDVIERGRADGLFQTDAASDVAWQLVGMIDGINAQSLVRGADPATVVAQLARAFETLLGAAPGSLSDRAGG